MISNNKCLNCQEYFKAGRMDAKYCSQVCRKRYNRSHPSVPLDNVSHNHSRTDGLVTLSKEQLSGIFAGTHDIYGGFK